MDSLLLGSPNPQKRWKTQNFKFEFKKFLGVGGKTSISSQFENGCQFPKAFRLQHMI